MNRTEFVRAVKLVVRDAAARSTIETLARPAGRRPDAALLKLSDWFKRLDAGERDYVARVAELAADQAAYNFLLVLDGQVAIEATGPKGRLKLIHEDRSSRVELNDESGEQLSFIFKEI